MNLLDPMDAPFPLLMDPTVLIVSRQRFGLRQSSAALGASGDTESARELCSLHGSPIPTGLRREAQGCEERATLGKGGQ